MPGPRGEVFAPGGCLFPGGVPGPGGGGVPGPVGVSAPRGVVCSHWGVGIPACTEADTPPPPVDRGHDCARTVNVEHLSVW